MGPRALTAQDVATRGHASLHDHVGMLAVAYERACLAGDRPGADAARARHDEAVALITPACDTHRCVLRARPIPTGRRLL